MAEHSSTVHARAPRVILGVDPGTLVTGYGVVARASGGTLCFVASGAIRNVAGQPMPDRLRKIFEGLQAVITDYMPDEFAIESAFYGKNAQSALKLGQARGVSLLAAAVNNLPCAEYSPREVKMAVVGSGAASKQQVQYMVRSILHMDDKPMLLDASDAIAVAICHLHRCGSPAHGTKSWKDFIAANPDRISS